MLERIRFKITLAFIWLISRLPNRCLMFWGGILGTIGYYLMKKRRNIGIKNLSLCFPDMSEKEKSQVIKEHFKYLVTAGLEYSLLFYGSADRLVDLVKLKNEHYFFEHYQKRPIIILSPHFVGLDLAGVRFSLKAAGYGLYSKQKNKLLTERVKEARLRFSRHNGAELFPRQDGLRSIIKKIRQTKLAFYYLPDQDLGERDSLYIPFFAHPTCATVNVLPKLVKLTGAVVIPAFVYRGKDHKYTLEFSPAWDNYPTDDLKQDIIRMNTCIEQMVLKEMPQYFWLHKRFKSQPNRERGSIYYE